MTSPYIKKPYIIVLGNEKGGTGKSTLSMHLSVHLLKLGFKVSTLDLDARQGTFSRYMENRQIYKQKTGYNLPLSQHFALFRSTHSHQQEADAQETDLWQKTLMKCQDQHFIIVDTPGTHCHLSRLAHSYADTLITPLNDSFIDLDMLARIESDQDQSRVQKPSIYAEMVWEQKKQRLMRDGGNIDWIVIRNRLTNLYARNKEEMSEVLEKLSSRIGFRIAIGFSERVIFRELFLSGLTLLDLTDIGQSLNLSHVAGRQELRSLLEFLKLPDVTEKLRMIS